MLFEGSLPKGRELPLVDALIGAASLGAEDRSVCATSGHRNARYPGLLTGRLPMRSPRFFSYFLLMSVLPRLLMPQAV